jgi:hypothetical protein
VVPFRYKLEREHEMPKAERTVLVGDTYETPEDAAQYATAENEALQVLGSDDEAEMRVIEREHERTEDE